MTEKEKDMLISMLLGKVAELQGKLDEVAAKEVRRQAKIEAKRKAKMFPQYIQGVANSTSSVNAAFAVKDGYAEACYSWLNSANHNMGGRATPKTSQNRDDLSVDPVSTGFKNAEARKDSLNKLNPYDTPFVEVVGPLGEFGGSNFKPGSSKF